MSPEDAREEAERVASSYCPSDVEVVDAGALMQLVDQGAIVVDARTTGERSVSRLPTSISIEEFERLGTVDDTVVVYCTVGARSGRYARRIAGQCKKVYNSKGIVPYSHHVDAFGTGPHALIDDNGPATRVHAFALPWKHLVNRRFEPEVYGPLQALWAGLVGD